MSNFIRKLQKQINPHNATRFRSVRKRQYAVSRFVRNNVFKLFVQLWDFCKVVGYITEVDGVQAKGGQTVITDKDRELYNQLMQQLEAQEQVKKDALLKYIQDNLDKIKQLQVEAPSTELAEATA